MKRGRVAVVTVALLSGAVLSGCSSGSTPGITDNSITITAVEPETGADAPGWSEVSVGAAAYFSYLNARGGINGRTIKYDVHDTKSDPALAAAAWKDVANSNDALVAFAPAGVDPALTAPSTVTDAGVPVVFAPGCPCWAHTGDVVGWAPDWTIEAKILGAYVAKHFQGKKVAYIGEAGPLGQAGLAGLQRELPHGQLVANVTYDPGSVDLSKQVQTIQRAHADVVVAFTRPTFTALLRLGLVAANFDPTLVVDSAGSDPATEATVLNGLGQKAGSQVDGPALVQGIITDTFLPPPAERSNEWIALFDEVHNQYIPQLPFDANIVYGMAAAYSLADALQRAGSNPTRDGLKHALESAPSQGPSLVPLAYGSSGHGATGAQIAIVHGGLHLVGSPQTTDAGDGPVRSVAASTAKPPVHGVPASP